MRCESLKLTQQICHAWETMQHTLEFNTRLVCLDDCAWLPHRDQNALSISTAACHCTCCSRPCCCAIDAAKVPKSPALLRAPTKSARSDIACMSKSLGMTLLSSQNCHKMASNEGDGTLFTTFNCPTSVHLATKYHSWHTVMALKLAKPPRVQ